MASVRDIKRKIRVVKNISQITQAMKMVAAAKLRRVQKRCEFDYANSGRDGGDDKRLMATGPAAD